MTEPVRHETKRRNPWLPVRTIDGHWTWGPVVTERLCLGDRCIEIGTYAEPARLIPRRDPWLIRFGVWLLDHLKTKPPRVAARGGSTD